MRILATDLDRTLLPNGRWPADPDAIDLFNELTRRHDVLVVYVTGRNLNLAEQRHRGIRHPPSRRADRRRRHLDPQVRAGRLAAR